jgi:hypothetical protein
MNKKVTWNQERRMIDVGLIELDASQRCTGQEGLEALKFKSSKFTFQNKRFDCPGSYQP